MNMHSMASAVPATTILVGTWIAGMVVALTAQLTLCMVLVVV